MSRSTQALVQSFHALAATTLLVSCAGDPVRITPRSFELPADVAFACFETASGSAVPIEMCGNPEEDEDHTLTALVTQTARGEVAAVDLKSSRVLDSDVRVPGFTFVPVGEMPTAIVVPPDNPAYTYVVDMGSLDILAVATNRFRPSEAPPAAPQPPLRVSTAPADLVIAPDGGALYATLPDQGAVLAIPLDAAGVMGEPVELVLGTTVPDASAAEPVPAYCKACLAPSQPACDQLTDPFPVDDAGERLPFPPREPVARGASARPTALEVDVEAGLLLVADENLPVVHVIDLATDMVRTPMTVGAPTTALALTPEVPESLDNESGTARYLYAVDAIEGNVIAVEYEVVSGQPEAAVLPVEIRAGRPADRIHFRAGVRSIEVVTPDYPGQPCSLEAQDLAGVASPGLLRGVFLAVGTRDGMMHIVDVHDLDAACRGGDLDCVAAPNDDDVEVYIERHRPRIASLITNAISVLGAPTISAEGLTFSVHDDGSTEGSLAPDLIPVEGGCDTTKTDVFPRIDGATDDLVCVLADPWAAVSEQWRADFEGAVPGATGVRGRLVAPASGGPAFEGEAPLCNRGVLGGQNVTGLSAEEPEAGYVGDVLVITGELPPSTEDVEECQGFVDGEDLELLDFPIVQARNHRLELAPMTRGGRSIEEVARCFPELVEYEVRVRDTFVVDGSVSGFGHRVTVTSDEDDTCVVDTTLDRALYSRATSDLTFDNDIVSFRIRTPSSGDGERVFPVRGDQTQLLFTVGQVPETFTIDVGALPISLVYNPTDQYLYVVDIASRGLSRIPISPYDSRLVESFL